MKKKFAGNAYVEEELEDTISESILLEKFYVYRSLHSDESWGALLIGSETTLPNCDFLMKVYAVNETAAIARARHLYETIHKNDSKRDNVKRFAAAALKSTTRMLCRDIQKSDDSVASDEQVEAAAKLAMRLAVSMDNEYESYFKKIDS